MGEESGIGPRIIIEFDNGFYITETVFWAVIVAVILIIFALVATRNLKRNPKGAQAVAELIVETVYQYVENTMGKRNITFAPFIGSIFLFLLLSNALGLIGFRPVTADVNATFALAILVFLVIQASSIRSKGIVGYLGHFLKPFPALLPLNILEEFTFPVSLGFRLFGNILAGVIIMELVFEGLAWLSTEAIRLPIPLLQAVLPLPLNIFFDVFEPVLQAFVFSMLTMAFITKAIAAHDDH
jgi:F-type H+-transporting ATPase subunit a